MSDGPTACQIPPWLDPKFPNCLDAPRRQRIWEMIVRDRTVVQLREDTNDPESQG